MRFLEKPSWGEAFSDTINTGIYILEPSAYRMIPVKTNYDFSQNLYPLMLSKQMGLYGKIMNGYWKDIGNVNEYQKVHADLLSGKLQLDLKMEPSTVAGATIYKGKNVRIGDDARLSGVVVLGERLRPAQWVAFGVGFAAVAVLAVAWNLLQ